MSTRRDELLDRIAAVTAEQREQQAIVNVAEERLDELASERARLRSELANLDSIEIERRIVALGGI